MKRSAGILLIKRENDTPFFFLVHPGGPFWKNKDAGAWSIPKGEYADDEDPLDAAIREFGEETGIVLTEDRSHYRPLTPVKLKSGKQVAAWMLERDADPAAVVSNTFEIEWPPKSGKQITVPEIDQAAWFGKEAALEKINEAQRTLVKEVVELMSW
jgi:predicted NUDIX family NTP pyrophosphohydrolase